MTAVSDPPVATPPAGTPDPAAAGAPKAGTPAANPAPSPAPAPATPPEGGKPAAEVPNLGNAKAPEQAKPADTKPFEWKWKDGERPADGFLTALEASARKHGMNAEAAQDVYQTLAGQLQTQHRTAVEAWGEAVRKDPEIGGDKLAESMAQAGKLLDRYGSPALREWLNTSGAGSHPDLVKFVVKLARDFSEDAITTGAPASNANKSLGELLYPGLAKKE